MNNVTCTVDKGCYTYHIRHGPNTRSTKAVELKWRVT